MTLLPRMQRLHRRIRTIEPAARALWRPFRAELASMATPTPSSPSLLRACDAHCHLHDERFRQERFEDPSDARGPASGRLDAVIQRAAAAGVTHAISCACHPDDWSVLELLLSVQQAERQRSAEGPRLEITPCFGLHPWWARQHSREASITPSLRDVLLRHPSAGLGEIGLCKSARGRQVSISVQEDAMRTQLALAVELERTCVIHCVGYYGKLLEVLADCRRKQRLPPRIVLHSYSGSPDMIPAFLALASPIKGDPTRASRAESSGTRLFFSLNARQLSDIRSSKAATCCTIMPMSALLLETDAPDQPPTLEAMQAMTAECALDVVAALRVGDSLLAAGLNEPMMVQLALHRAAKLRAMPVEELAGAVFQNSRDAFGF